MRAYVTCVSGSPLVPDHCAGRAVHRGQSKQRAGSKGQASGGAATVCGLLVNVAFNLLLALGALSES